MRHTSFKNILLKKKDGVATITLNRPEVLNVFHNEMFLELIRAIREVDEDPGVRVAVITGAGRAFSAGRDLITLDAESPLDYFEVRIHLANTILRSLLDLGKPVIAIVNGYALGMGMALALACDIRVANPNAKFSQAEIEVGLIPDVSLLTRLVGKAKALELCYTGDMIDAREAERIGLVNKVVPTDKVSDYVMDMAERIAKKDRHALKYTKIIAQRTEEITLDASLDLEGTFGSVAVSTGTLEKATNAFRERRRKERTKKRKGLTQQQAEDIQ